MGTAMLNLVTGSIDEVSNTVTALSFMLETKIKDPSGVIAMPPG